MTGEWKWYASADGEVFTVGPCDSREQAIEEAKENELGYREDGVATVSFDIVEAFKAPIDLADMIDLQDIIERFEDCNDLILDEDGESCLSGLTTEQGEELSARLKQAARDWQAERGIVITPWRFTKTRNDETITITLEPENV